MAAATGLPEPTPIGRILRSAEFQRVLATPARSRSAHFALHFAQAQPGAPRRPALRELSTGDAPEGPSPVDDLSGKRWLGAVVPKRHARRAVTRTLCKRQIREAMRRHQSALRGGLWVVRLRAPFERAQFPSAASTALRDVVRAELDQLFARAAR